MRQFDELLYTQRQIWDHSRAPAMQSDTLKALIRKKFLIIILMQKVHIDKITREKSFFPTPVKSLNSDFFQRRAKE